MDPNDILRKVHRQVLDSIQKKSSTAAGAADGMKSLIAKDQAVRKAIADLYASLVESKDPALAVELLSEHVAIMVEMINDFKSKIQK